MSGAHRCFICGGRGYTHKDRCPMPRWTHEEIERDVRAEGLQICIFLTGVLLFIAHVLVRCP